jgi:arylsulfatase A-like enzyme
MGADGLRPDMLDPETMPNLFKLIRSGVRFNDHHATYPPHTRVQATTFVTGTHPGQHGIVANTMLIPGSTEDHIVNTGDYQHLDALAQSDPTGEAQYAPTLSDILRARGERVAVTGNGSTGSNVLWTFHDRSRLINTSSAYGIADLYDLREKLGPIPDAAIPQIERNQYVARAVAEVFLQDPSLRVVTAWFAEPDTTFHYRGLGSPESIEALQSVDACLGVILDAMNERGVRDQFEILFLSDHGHSTVRAHKSLREFLQDAKSEIGTLPALSTASDYIYAEPGTAEPSAEELRPLVEWLQAQSWVDIVAGGRDDLAMLPGVLSLTELWAGHTNPRRPLLAVSPSWNDIPNRYGVPGTVDALTTQGALQSSHGSLSPYDMHATFIASGPSFREDIVTNLPTGGTDIMPTILSILGLDVPDTVSGRVVSEALANQEADIPEVRSVQVHAQNPGVHERAAILNSVGSSVYVHGSAQQGNVERMDERLI